VRFFVIEHDETVFDYPTCTYNVVGRCFYVSSAAKNVDPKNPIFAKFFPTLKSAKQAISWAGSNPKILEVDVQVDIIGEYKET
jgi:hypothetical protein